MFEKHLEANQESGNKFYLEFHDKGKIVMLNLLKFRTLADYSDFESLKPENEISGEEAYTLYMEKTLPELEKAGSKVLFYGDSKNYLIGPENEVWDAVLLVEHQSVKKFIAFAQNENYLKIKGHRTAALENSRLLPMSQKR